MEVSDSENPLLSDDEDINDDASLETKVTFTASLDRLTCGVRFAFLSPEQPIPHVYPQFPSSFAVGQRQ